MPQSYLSHSDGRAGTTTKLNAEWLLLPNTIFTLTSELQKKQTNLFQSAFVYEPGSIRACQWYGDFFYITSAYTKIVKEFRKLCRALVLTRFNGKVAKRLMNTKTWCARGNKERWLQLRIRLRHIKYNMTREKWFFPLWLKELSVYCRALISAAPMKPNFLIVISGRESGFWSGWFIPQYFMPKGGKHQFSLSLVYWGPPSSCEAVRKEHTDAAFKHAFILLSLTCESTKRLLLWIY